MVTMAEKEEVKVSVGHEADTDRLTENQGLHQVVVTQCPERMGTSRRSHVYLWA